MRTPVLFSILLSGLLFSAFKTENRMPKYQIRTVVIDPGHGGHDSGCLGSSSQEKHVALAVSLKLGALIEKHFPDVKVIYTRKTDVFIELHERAAIANRNRADLFICIHCNSGPSAAFGAETYVMGLHKTADNLSVAKRENSAILLEKDYQNNYDGFDPNSPEANIIFSLYQNTFLHQSLHFASLVQERFEKNSGRFNRGVKQAGFLVLFRTAMPSVLIELGFLTNRSDEQFLAGDRGQDSMAESLLAAFREYKSDTERKAGGAEEPVVETPKPDTKPAEQLPAVRATTNASVPVDEKATDIQIVKSDELQDNLPQTGRVFFTIQVGAAPNSAVGEDLRFKKIPDIRKIIGDDGMTRFYTGTFTSMEETKTFLNRLREMGFKDAFVCAFEGARRISVTEASQLLKRK